MLKIWQHYIPITVIINKFTKITHLIRFHTDCKASYNVKTGRQSVSILLQEGLVKLIASH